jgi:type IV pilus assembly protein PilQ
VHFAAAQNRDQLPLRDIDFRRGPDGAGRVIVALASNQVGVDIRQQGQSLVVEFLRSSLPETLRRRLDVADFGTPVQSMPPSRAASGCAWSWSRAATGSTAPTRATTSSCWKCGR